MLTVIEVGPRICADACVRTESGLLAEAAVACFCDGLEELLLGEKFLTAALLLDFEA